MNTEEWIGICVYTVVFGFCVWALWVASEKRQERWTQLRERWGVKPAENKSDEKPPL